MEQTEFLYDHYDPLSHGFGVILNKETGNFEFTSKEAMEEMHRWLMEVMHRWPREAGPEWWRKINKNVSQINL